MTPKLSIDKVLQHFVLFRWYESFANIVIFWRSNSLSSYSKSSITAKLYSHSGSTQSLQWNIFRVHRYTFAHFFWHVEQYWSDKFAIQFLLGIFVLQRMSPWNYGAELQRSFAVEQKILLSNAICRRPPNSSTPSIPIKLPRPLMSSIPPHRMIN